MVHMTCRISDALFTPVLSKPHFICAADLSWSWDDRLLTTQYYQRLSDGYWKCSGSLAALSKRNSRSLFYLFSLVTGSWSVLWIPPWSNGIGSSFPVTLNMELFKMSSCLQSSFEIEVKVWIERVGWKDWSENWKTRNIKILFFFFLNFTTATSD